MAPTRLAMQDAPLGKGMHPEGWQENELEHLGACPVCGSTQRTLMFDDLEDWAFRAAPGKWSMWSCAGCASAYLDPRLTPETIHRAYRTYYTHVSGYEHQVGGVKKIASQLKHALRRGYYGSTFGHPAGAWAKMLGYGLKIMPKAALSADLAIRHLPHARPGEKLLDLGSGSGDFLRLATELGYTAVGLEADPVAVAAGQAVGHDVRLGGFPGTRFADAEFGQATMSHVLEHLHSPLKALRDLHRIIAPGGRLWLALPNRAALGLTLFGKHWRGLECPRHLALFTQDTLTRMLADAGFTDITFLPHPPSGHYMAQSSVASGLRRLIRLARLLKPFRETKT
jgi:SAM-dependent methyltransferase